jgi:hypothetical protein
MNITKEQLERANGGQPVEIAENGDEYVLIRKDVYQRVKSILYDDGDVTDEEAAQLAWEAGKAIGWDTPEMAEYEKYDKHRKSQ